ncbi:MAG: membrane protein insertase YidC [Melioribacteraceae bacterium]|nr:membrane protein insertase YidC [Melioribacteraceae bacterium]
MDRQTSIAFVLIGLVLVVWLYFNSPTPQDIPKDKPAPAVTEKTDSTENNDSLKELSAPVTAQIPLEQTPFGTLQNSMEELITVETDLARIEFTNKGGRIKRFYLKQYKTWYHSDVKDTSYYTQQVQLVSSKSGGDLSVIFLTKEGKLVNTSILDFTPSLNNSHYIISGNDSLSLSYIFSTDNGKTIKKNFKLFGNNYASKMDLEFENMDDIISGFRYDLVWSSGLNFVEKNATDEATHSNASAYMGEEQVIVDAASDGSKITKDLNGKVDWISIRNKYFTMLIAPDNPKSEGGAYFEGNYYKNKWGDRETYSASLKIPFNDQKYQKDSFTFYLGPIQYDILKAYNLNFEKVVDFGSFFGLKFIIRPISEYVLLPLFKFLHSFVPNFGFVIILFSIIIKIALHPLTRQSLYSMRKMQLLQPKINEMKEKFKDNPQKQQQETMKLYSTYGINPMGGCLPMILQMPIFIALWSLFNNAVEIRQQPFMFWINNLSAPDVLVRLPFTIPLFEINIISGLAVLMGVTMFIQQKMSIKDPSQKALVYIMPVMFTLMFMTFPSGLNLYYFMFNLLSIIQQYYVTHKKGQEELVPVADPNKKKGFMARMMEAAEKQAQAQKKLSGKKK